MAQRDTIVIAGGGTGGHVIPAIAIADVFFRRGWPVRFVGTRGRLEERLVPQAGYGIDFIDVKPLVGGGVRTLAAGLAGVPGAVVRAARLLRRNRAAAVIGVGGYVSGPVVLAGHMAGAVTAFLEQNATLGLANKLLLPFVHRVFLSYPDTPIAASLRRAVHTGNPVRADIAAVADAPRHGDGAVHLLVTGGSQGAATIDAWVPAALAESPLASRVVVRHQAHRSAVDTVAARYREAGIEATVEPFIEDMAAAYAWCDVVVCRSGATTVAELGAAGRPAVLIPYPHHADRQQYRNAQPLVRAGAAVIVDEKTQDVADLRAALERWIGDAAAREQAARAARSWGRPDAAERIADAVEELLRR